MEGILIYKYKKGLFFQKVDIGARNSFIVIPLNKQWRLFKLVSILSDVYQFHHDFTQVFVSPAVYKRTE